jgi:dihydrofolate reductase
MTKVIWHVTMSLDGFIAGTDHAMQWAFDFGDSSPMADDVMGTTGAILAGRRWYDVATERYDGRAGIYGGNWEGPVFVLTHDPPHDVSDPGITLLTGGIRDAVASARAAAADGNLEIFGAETAQGVLREGLLDEIVIHLAPVLLGDGIRLYGPGMETVALERTELVEAGRLTSMRFTVPG